MPIMRSKLEEEEGGVVDVGDCGAPKSPSISVINPEKSGGLNAGTVVGLKSSGTCDAGVVTPPVEVPAITGSISSSCNWALIGPVKTLEGDGAGLGLLISFRGI